MDATTLQARVTGAKRAKFRIAFEIRRSGEEGWATLATDGKAPFRQVVELSDFEPGDYEVRAVASAKGYGRYTSSSLEITIPEPKADDQIEDRGKAAGGAEDQESAASVSWESPQADQDVPTAAEDGEGSPSENGAEASAAESADAISGGASGGKDPKKDKEGRAKDRRPNRDRGRCWR